jgi:HPt (histidine-containing phosphotransfer) domain-containing protein
MLQAVTENISPFAELLRQHRAVYVASLPQRVAQLDALAQQFGQPDQAEDSATLHALERCAHALAGSAGTFGFHSLGETARTLELDVVDAQEGADRGAQIAAGLAALRSQLEGVIAEHGQGETAQ